jgi:hypothetical protein
VIDVRTVRELNDLRARGIILFDSFKLWGPLLDAGHGGTLVPVVERAVATPDQPDSALPDVTRAEGNRLSLGVADLLAATEAWARLIDAALIGLAGRRGSRNHGPPTLIGGPATVERTWLRSTTLSTTPPSC